MRYVCPDLGDKRQVTWFAFLPVTIGREVRWLECVTVLQTCASIAADDFGAYTEGWVNTKFVDEDRQPGRVVREGCHMNAEAELIALRSMCRAAAAEIEKHWDAHCDAEGYGPCNLHARLSGKLRPDLYLGHASDEEIARFNELMRQASAAGEKGVG